MGFSGTLHGLIIAGTLADLRYYPKSAGVLLVLVVGKLAWEQSPALLPGSESVAGGQRSGQRAFVRCNWWCCYGCCINAV